MNYEEKLTGLIEFNEKLLANSPNLNMDIGLRLKVRAWKMELDALRAAHR